MNAQNFTQKSLEAVQTAQSMAQENRDLALYGWHRAVECAKGWVETR